MNHYFLTVLIGERQHQLSKDAGAARLATSRNTSHRYAKGTTDTPRHASFTYQRAVGRILSASEGSKI